jgi:hypothetical protein
VSIVDSRSAPMPSVGLWFGSWSYALSHNDHYGYVPLPIMPAISRLRRVATGHIPVLHHI